MEEFFGGGNGIFQVHLPQFFFPPSDDRGSNNNDDDFFLPSRNDDEEEFGLDRMFERMNKLMEWTMNKVKTSIPEGFGSGKLVVIQSGPGYQETKTYNIGPDVKMNDMSN